MGSFIGGNTLALDVYGKSRGIKVPDGPEDYFVSGSTLILRFIERSKRPRRDNTMLNEKNKVGELTLLYFKAYCKTVIIRESGIGRIIIIKYLNRSVEQKSEPRLM